MYKNGEHCTALRQKYVNAYRWLPKVKIYTGVVTVG